MRRISRLLEELLDLVDAGTIVPLGVAADETLVATGLRSGESGVFQVTSGGLVKLNREPLLAAFEPRAEFDIVPAARDVSKGAEQSVVVLLRVGRPGEEEVVKELEPLRIFNVVVNDGGRLAVSGATMDAVGVWIVEPGRSARLAVKAQGLVVATSASRGLLAGTILLDPSSAFQKGFVADPETGELRVFDAGEASSVVLPRVAEDGGIVFAALRSDSASLYRLDPDGMKVEPLELEGKDLERFSPREISFIDVRGGHIAVVASRDYRSKAFLDGYEVELPEGFIYSAPIWRGGLAVGRSSLVEPPEIVEAAPGRKPKRVAAVARPWWLPEALAGRELVWIESFDGEKVPTLVIYSGRAPKPGPTVVLVHGGPFAAYYDQWSIMAASLAAAGFHVVMPNYRGSTGMGEEWRLKIVGDPCGGELEDIAAAARWARESGLASSLYIAGYSYGGYMTLCALTRKPGVFKAGVAGASVADWEEMYELSDAAFKYFIEYLFAGRRELWKERSPITHIDNMRDPLCIIHPQNDSRTPLKPVLRFMREAGEKGKTFEAHIAPDMGHAINTAREAVKIIWPLLEFLVEKEKGL